MRFAVLASVLLFMGASPAMQGQSFFFGVDLSYINEMEDCGAVYMVNGEAQDPYAIFRDKGCNLVRLRLWHTPSWYDNLNQGFRYGDFADVKRSIQRAKVKGMQILLDFHLSDNWADPSHQVVPAAWAGIVEDLDVLEDSLYNYIYTTLYRLAQDSLLPEIVQIGNETNKGILQSQEQNDSGWFLDWPKNKRLFNAAIDAVRDIETETAYTIKVALHVANPGDVEWMLGQFRDNGVQDFDIIGISYYPAYHGIQLLSTGNVISSLKSDYPGKDVMIFETACPWTTGAADAANNLINIGAPGYPVSPAGQKLWMTDLTQTVIDHGGSGVVYWEPAWLSTDCSTQWAQGSHWENCTFFDFNNSLIENGGIGWMAHPYDFPSGTNHFTHHLPVTIQYMEGQIMVSTTPLIAPNMPMVLSVHTMDGSQVFSGLLPESGAGENFTIPVQSLVPGMYFVCLAARGQPVATQRLIIPE